MEPPSFAQRPARDPCVSRFWVFGGPRQSGFVAARTHQQHLDGETGTTAVKAPGFSISVLCNRDWVAARSAGGQ